MWTDSQLREMHQAMCGRMLDAGWLKRFAWTDGKGLSVVWTEDGALISLKLKHWHSLLRLGDGDAAMILLYPLTHGQRLGVADAATDAHAALQAYVAAGFARSFRASPSGVAMEWTDDGRRFCRDFRALCSALGHSGTEDDTHLLFSLATGWGPGPDTRIVTQ